MPRIEQKFAPCPRCRTLSHVWIRGGAELLDRPAGRVKFPGPGRPLAVSHEVLLEDLVAAIGTGLDHLRELYPGTTTPKVWLDAHLQGVVSDLRKAIIDVGADILTVTASEWGRRRQASAERVTAAMLGWELWTLRRRLHDSDRVERADFRSERCEDCGSDTFGRRSEPQRRPLCSLCRERRLWAAYGPLDLAAAAR